MSGSFCSNCGSNLAPGAVFCSNCGKSNASSQSSNQTYSQPPSSYSSPPQTNYYNTTNYSASTNKDKPLTVGEYIVLFIIPAIPLVGFIMLLVWAFGSDVNTNKKNYSRAMLILGLISGALFLILAIILPLLFAGLFSGINW